MVSDHGSAGVATNAQSNLFTGSTGTGAGRTIAAGEFKAKCLKLLDEVAETGEPLIVTKFGKPVAQVVPMPQEPFMDIIGAMKGSVLWEGDIISPLEDEWEANRD